MFFDETELDAEMPEINVIPLIDVLFFIVIFFVVSTSFTQQSGFDVNLPTSSAHQQARSGEDIVIALTKDGSIVFEGEAHSPVELEEALKRSLDGAARKLVVVNADKSVAHGRVVQVMDLAKRAGAAQLAIATNPDDQG